MQLGLEDVVGEEGVPGGWGPHRDGEVGSTAGDPGLVSRCRRPAGGRGVSPGEAAVGMGWTLNSIELGLDPIRVRLVFSRDHVVCSVSVEAGWGERGVGRGGGPFG